MGYETQEFSAKERKEVLKLIDQHRYFKLREFTCKCQSCQKVRQQDREFDRRNFRIRKIALLKLFKLRKELRSPIGISSAYRCLDHEKEKVKDDKSFRSHNLGLAFDIKVKGSFNRAKVLLLGVRLLFKGIGLANTFVHLDARSWDAIWVYEGVK